VFQETCSLNMEVATLDFLLDRYNVRKQKSPISLPYRRWDRFPKLIKQLGFTVGAEIGVDRGRFAIDLCRFNPQLKLFGVDAWKLYRDYDGAPGVNQDMLSSFYKSTKEAIKPYNIKLVKAFSMDAVKKFVNKSLDFVYIDANNRYEYIMDDIKEWSKKVKPGGLVAGRNYYSGIARDFGYMQTNYGVKKAVDEWVRKNKIRQLFVLTGEPMPSWFYVKA
jgi:hypothetical protein